MKLLRNFDFWNYNFKFYNLVLINYGVKIVKMLLFSLRIFFENVPRLLDNGWSYRDTRRVSLFKIFYDDTFVPSVIHVKSMIF